MNAVGFETDPIELSVLGLENAQAGTPVQLNTVSIYIKQGY